MKKVEKHEQYNAACVALNQQPMTLEMFSIYKEKDRVSKFALHRMETVMEADNLTSDEGKPFIKDWKKRNQKSYIPFYWVEDNEKRPSEVGFSLNATYYDHALTVVGSRLGCISSERIMTILGTPEMVEAYHEYMGV